MTFNEYQKAAWKTALPRSQSFAYLIPGICAEVGEVAGKYAKYVRGDMTLGAFMDYVRAELGDVQWFVAALTELMEENLEAIAEENIKKLQDRQNRGKLQGDGDQR